MIRGDWITGRYKLGVWIKEAEATGGKEGEEKLGQLFKVKIIEKDIPALISLLDEYDVKHAVGTVDSGISGIVWRIFPYLPIVFFVVFFVLIILFMPWIIKKIDPSKHANQWRKSRHHQVSDEQRPKERFKDVAGIDETKAELEEVIEFLKNPKNFTRLGAEVPKGILLLGPPGCGKTLLAKAVAGEAKVPFLSTSGSTFVEMFVGVGASRVRDLFDKAKKCAPCIVFIDEIDAVGRHRGAGYGGGHDEREQTLNQILTNMDGFDSTSGIIILAATNRPDILDPALLRPGRFDRKVYVPQPDVKGREAILKVHGKKIKLAKDVDFEKIAKETTGATGADLENIVNEAALMAARCKAEAVTMTDFENAIDKITMGTERRMIISPKEKEVIAYHEAGHALMMELIPEADPVNKVSVIPRGMALGVTKQLTVEDKYVPFKKYIKASLSVLLGGRVAEEIVFTDITTGAKGDIERATQLSEQMVCEWGMSEKLGPMTFGKKRGNIFLAKEFGGRQKDYSEETAKLIDEEKKKFVNEAYARAKKVLGENKKALDTLAKALLEKETLEAEEVQEIIEKAKKTE
jgi:cell division protease FtsH